MDEHTVRMLGYLLAAYTRVLGMQAENAARQMRSESPAYTGDDFFREAMSIETTARHL